MAGFDLCKAWNALSVSEIHAKKKEEQEEDDAETKAIKEMTLDNVELLEQKTFIIGDFTAHCLTHDGVAVPAEGAVVEFSLERGIISQWHSILNPGPIPVGYRSQCIENSKKTHHIPLGNYFFQDKRIKVFYWS